MEHHTRTEAGRVAAGLRPVIFAYAAANIVVAVLLLSTVTPTPTTTSGQRAAAAYEFAGLQ